MCCGQAAKEVKLEKISLAFILRATGGRLGHACFNLKFDSICTDTRAITPGCLFVALRGERFDGNDYLDEAFRKGASACLAQKQTESGDVILVDDSRAALRRLAAAYRRLFDIPVVAVTGSVGKTSTKEMIAAVLSQRWRTHKNEGNRNNEIGMPLSVFGLTRAHGAAVFEMGMSGFGEISRLSDCASPNIAVITNIGLSHIGMLGSQQNILKAKLEILDGLRPGGTLVRNGDDPLLRSLRAEELPGKPKIITYGVENVDCDARADHILINETSTSFDLHLGGENVPVTLPVCGRHHVYNALAAALCGRLLGVTLDQAAAGLAGFALPGFRQKIVPFKGMTLIEDCYNASPDSMKAAFGVLDAVAAASGGRKIAVLADMLELGSEAGNAHYETGKLAARSANVLYAFGEHAVRYCEGFAAAGGDPHSCSLFDSREELAKALAAQMKPGDIVLFKGSRGMRLEDAIKMVCEGWEGR